MKPLILAALAVLLPCSASAQVFKCVDANGKTTYSDNGCAAGHTTSTLAITPTKVSASEVVPYQIPPAYYAPPVPRQPQGGPRVTVVGANNDAERQRKKLCKQVSTPYKGAPGLTSSQLAAAAKICAGIDISLPDRAENLPRSAPGGSASAPTAPAQITNCDSAGCWDTNGARYNRGAGTAHFPAAGGPACQLINGQMICP